MILRQSTSVAYPSFDRYLRITRTELEDISLEHLWTDQPSSADGRTLGYTEWSGSHGGRVVSVACFWRLYADGPSLSSDPLDVSTNVMLVDAKGYDMGTHETGSAFLAILRMHFSSSNEDLAHDGRRH